MLEELRALLTHVNRPDADKSDYFRAINEENRLGKRSGKTRILTYRHLVDRLAPMVEGRLLVFFPGSYENNNYRLLDGYDGWNYLAVPITADKEY